MSCKDCLNNCNPAPISDQCVKYTGPDNDTLGIKSGDALYCVQNAVIEYLASLVDGTGITLDYTTACSFLTGLVNSDKSLQNTIQAFATAICELKDAVDDLQPVSTSYDSGCLSLPSNPKTEDVVKALVTKVCSISTDVAAIKADYVKSSEVTTIVQNIITTNSQSTVQEYTKMVKYVAYPYHGSLSNFDSNGKGLSVAGFDKVYLCVGQTVNGFTLPDYRGRVAVGVNVNVPGGAMDTNVDPAQAANAGYQVTLNGKKGAFTHTLSPTENAPHTHGVTDSGHKHWITVKSRDFKNDAGTGSDHTNDGSDTRSVESDIAYTGISIQSSGGGQPHNNLQPSVGAYHIMFVP